MFRIKLPICIFKQYPNIYTYNPHVCPPVPTRWKLLTPSCFDWQNGCIPKFPSGLIKYPSIYLYMPYSHQDNTFDHVNNGLIDQILVTWPTRYASLVSLTWWCHCGVHHEVEWHKHIGLRFKSTKLNDGNLHVYWIIIETVHSLLLTVIKHFFGRTLFQNKYSWEYHDQSNSPDKQ